MGDLDKQKISLDLVVKLKDTKETKLTIVYIVSLAIVTILNLATAYVLFKGQ